jgi:hypothetical protein
MWCNILRLFGFRCAMLDDVERNISGLTIKVTDRDQDSVRCRNTIELSRSIVVACACFCSLKRLCVEFQLSILWFWAFTITRSPAYH